MSHIINSPQFIGVPTAPTPAVGDNSTTIATTEFVARALSTEILTISTKSTTYTLTSADYIVLADATSGAFVVSLPLAPTIGQTFTVKKKDSSVNAVTIGGNNKTIDGAASVVLTAQYQSWTLIYDGTAWFAI